MVEEEFRSTRNVFGNARYVVGVIEWAIVRLMQRDL